MNSSFDPAQFFEVGTKVFRTLQEAVDEAACESMREEMGYSSQICQTLKAGVYGYAGTSVVIAYFRNGVDLNSLAADEDGVPDLTVCQTALVATPTTPSLVEYETCSAPSQRPRGG